MIKSSIGMVAAVAATAVGLTGATMSGVVRASDPVGVYCVINRVVLEPTREAPERLQLWGACASAVGGMMPDRTYVPGWYSEPERDFLYYSLPAGKEALARREWADLERAAGTGAVVAFGSRGLPVGRMRTAQETPQAPSVYPIHLGVTRLDAARPSTPAYADLFTKLVAAAK